MTVSYCRLCEINHSFCSCCGIGIFQYHIEEDSNPVGDYLLCGDCYLRMNERGHIELNRWGDSRYPMQEWLFPDGKTLNVSFLGA